MADISLIPEEYKEKQFNLASISSKIGTLIIALIVLSLLVFGGLYFYNRSLTGKINDLKAQIDNLNKGRDKNFESKVKFLDEALKNSRILLKNHLYFSGLFEEIEKLTVPQVSFSDCDAILNSDGSLNLTLSGKTSSYTYLAKQMVSFSQDKKLVKDVKVLKISLGTAGGIEFSLTVNFLKDILLK